MLRMINPNHKPVRAIEKGKPGIYWNSRGGQYYAYNGKSGYAMCMFSDEKIPINSIKCSGNYDRIYRLTPKEVAMHIEILERDIPSIRFQIGWLEKHLSLISRKRARNS